MPCKYGRSQYVLANIESIHHAGMVAHDNVDNILYITDSSLLWSGARAHDALSNMTACNLPDCGFQTCNAQYSAVPALCS